MIGNIHLSANIDNGKAHIQVTKKASRSITQVLPSGATAISLGVAHERSMARCVLGARDYVNVIVTEIAKAMRRPLKRTS